MLTDSEINQGLSSIVEHPSGQHSSHLVYQTTSLFHKLATETIEQIFLEACPIIVVPAQEPGTLGKNYSFRWVVDPMILLVVCRRWYMIMKAYRLLWSTIYISGWVSQTIGKAEWNQWGIIQLRDRLNRSGTHPLRIHISGDRDDRLAVPEILDEIMLHSERWKSVEFAFKLENDLLDSLMGRRFPRLKSLDFCPCIHAVAQGEITRANLGGMLIGAPSLTLIRFGRSELPISLLRNIPWTQLSEVIFDGSSFQYHQDFRELCKYLSVSITTLKFLSIRFTCEEMFDNFESDEKPITLPKLRRLRMDCNLEGLLNVLICPSLEWLHIEQTDGNELLYFLDANSSCALKHIHLYDIQPGLDGPDTYHQALEAPPSSTLRSISLRELTDEVLDLLVYDSEKRFPFLETLRLDLSYGRDQTQGNQLWTSQIEGLQKIVESRTQDTSLNHESLTSVHTLQFPCNRNDGESSLKNFFMEIRLGSGIEPKLHDYWDLKPLEALHRSCLSRGVCSEQVICLGLKRII